jgi:ubiquinol-cytochrome c reductase cytochrome c1 subunit
MRIKKTWLVAVAAGLMTTMAYSALASSEGPALQAAGNDIFSQASLQRGARNFVGYCLGCHSAKYVRWNRVATDLGIPEADNAPPDMSLLARARGTDYIYSYLMSFYADDTRPHGVNNLVLPGTAMPHVLAGLQGLQQPVYATHTGEDGKPHAVVEKLEPGDAGQLPPEQYASFVRDTVNFIEYIGEPVQAKRRTLGVWVVLFLLVFTAFAYLLKQEYWKDVK